MLHDDLWQRNSDLVRKCLSHPFVRGVADGSLDRDAFKRYIAQDAFFLRAFFRAYAVAAAKGDDLVQACTFWRLMEGVLDELKLHAKYSKDLGIDLSIVEPLPAARAYTDFLVRTAWHNGVDQIVAAMVPCMRLYAFLGQKLAPCVHSEHPFQKWIATYSGDEFEVLAAELEALLDALAQDTPQVRNAYRYAMQCEVQFFTAPLEAPQ